VKALLDELPLADETLKLDKKRKGRTPHAVTSGIPSTAPTTGRPLSLKSIQKALSTVNQGDVYNQAAYTGNPTNVNENHVA